MSIRRAVEEIENSRAALIDEAQQQDGPLIEALHQSLSAEQKFLNSSGLYLHKIISKRIRFGLKADDNCVDFCRRMIVLSNDPSIRRGAWHPPYLDVVNGMIFFAKDETLFRIKTDRTSDIHTTPPIDLGSDFLQSLSLEEIQRFIAKDIEAGLLGVWRVWVIESEIKTRGIMRKLFNI